MDDRRFYWNTTPGNNSTTNASVFRKNVKNKCKNYFYASAFRRRRHYVFGLSVRPKPEIPSFDLYMGPLVHPTNRNRFTACPSVRAERFPGICRRMHAGIGLKFYMLMYLDHLQNWLAYGRVLIFSCDQAALWMVFSVRLSVRHTFLTMFPSSWNFQELSHRTRVTSMQMVKVKGQGHRGHNPT